MAIGNVLNRTTKHYHTDVDLTQYAEADWIHDPDLSAVEDVMRRYWNIVGDTVTEMSQASKEAVDAADLATFKAHGTSRILRDMHAYIEGKYPSVVFNMLNNLDSDAVNSDLVNRMTYIDDMRDWFISLHTQRDTHDTAIAACTTLEAIEAVVWDFSSFDASDPAITVKGALAITD